MFGNLVFLHLEIRSCLLITKTASFLSSHVQPLCVSSIYFSDSHSPRATCKVYKSTQKQKEKKIKPEKRTSCPLYWSCELSSPLQETPWKPREPEKRTSCPYNDLVSKETPRNHFHLFIISMFKINFDDITESAFILSLEIEKFIWRTWKRRKNLICLSSLCASVTSAKTFMDTSHKTCTTLTVLIW